MAAPTDLIGVQSRATAMLPGLLTELGRLVAIPSVAFPGFPSEPVHAMAAAVVDLFERSGAPQVRLLEVPGGYPAVYADIPGPAGSPTVLLYAHYDVQPAPPEQGWSTDPWTATTGADGRIYGRGAADDKAGLVIHAGTLRVFDGQLPVGVRVLIEGEEETVSHLDGFLAAHPDLVRADAFVIADMGNLVPGQPALTTALRGEVSCTVTVSTLAHPVHSGLFGGAAPDALTSLVRVLATLHEPSGDVAVAGVESGPWAGAELDEAAFRASAGLLDGVHLVGTGTLASRLWSKPSVTVIGIDAPSVAEAANILVPEATAKVSMRIVPGADPDAELDRLTAHLQAAAPWGVRVRTTRVKTGWPFQVDVNAPAIRAATEAMSAAYGTPVGAIGSGGSIPLIESLRRVSPDAAVILWGPEDMARSRIHASDESVDPAEIEQMIVTQALTLMRLGATHRPG